MSARSAPGKTAPRLLEDFYKYDPAIRYQPGQNVLTDMAPRYEEGLPRRVLTRPLCQHRIMLKFSQSKLRESTGPPNGETYYKVPSYCLDCRWHTDLVVDFRGGDPSCTRPCPNEDFPLHHFRYCPSTANQNTFDREGQNQQTHIFECSSPFCPATASFQVRPPRITPNFLSLLTDRQVIKARFEKAVSQDPNRYEGFKQIFPSTVLSNLRTYIFDALSTTPEKRRRFNVFNKNFATTLGEDCTPILISLGFSRITEHDESGKESTYWLQPEIAEEPNSETPSTHRTFLEDFHYELSTILKQQPSREALTVPPVDLHPQPANKEFGLSLDTLTYEKEAVPRNVDWTQPEHPHYASLGALPDFSDDLIAFAHDRQKTCDPESAPYYFDCLHGMAEGRNSEQLKMRVGVLASSGELSYKSIMDSYKYFGLDPSRQGLTDDTIIGAFKARLEDSSKTQELDMREHLRIIGVSRSSDKIQSLANRSLSSYSEALTWLDADQSTSDDFIVSLAGVKMNDNAADTETTRRAVSIVAEKRNSDGLRNWLSTGQVDEVDMDIGTAYSRLGIDDRTTDEETTISVYELFISDHPDRINELRTALRVIGKELRSQKIETYLAGGQSSTQKGSAEWPVGLENIGNTCYLNSLLQYLFSIKPLRDKILLEYDMLKINPEEMEVDNVGKSIKRILSTKITAKEIRLAQEFGLELQNLFQQLIEAQTSSIKPTRNLALRTLMPLGGRGRRLTISESESRPIPGLQLSPEEDAGQGPSEPNSTTAEGVFNDNASEETLVDKPSSYEGTDDFLVVNDEIRGEQHRILEEKENLAPTKAEAQDPQSSPHHQEPLADAGDSKANEQSPLHVVLGKSGTGIHDIEMTDVDFSEKKTPPSRPPPIPPRPAATTTQKSLDEAELSRQQDVAEVFGNVLLQLECAIRPDKLDENNEQLDYVKRLFYGKTKNVMSTTKGVKRGNEEWFSDIKINVASGPCDIYTALDGAFDEQEVQVDNASLLQYTTISQLPFVLQVFVQRSQWDHEKKVQYKVESFLAMEDVIYLDRYLDPSLNESSPDIGQLRQKAWDLKKKLSTLQQQKEALTKTDIDATIPDTLNGAKEFVKVYESIDIDDMVIIDQDVSRILEDAATQANQKLESINHNIQTFSSELNNLFAADRKVAYRLHAVFMHRGSSSFGHYWIYINDFRKNLWRKYNDSYVTEVDRKEVFEQEETRPATPYFLVYVRDDYKTELSDPLCRHIQPESGMAVEVDMVDQVQG